MDALDAALLLGVGLTAWRGLRLGFVVGACSLLALFGGAVGAAAVLPAALHSWHWTGLVGALAAVAVVLLVALVAQWFALVLGTRWQARAKGRTWRRLDAVLGAVTVAVLFALAVAAVAPAVERLPLRRLDAQIRGSRTVEMLQAAFPFAGSLLIAPFSALATATGLAGIGGALTAAPVAGQGATAPLATGPVLTAAVRRDAASVVRILGDARGCGQTQEGSGFVVAPQRVMTNAHVVAGVRAPNVQVGGRGPLLRARVVLFDPSVDVAVLDVPGLRAPALALSIRPQPNGQRAVAVGFPENGPYTAGPASITGTVQAVGPTQGEPAQGSRQVFTLAAQIEPGNSGGPLLSSTGAVLGVVFARSTQTPGVGYALTAAEVASAAAAAAGLDQPVSTGGCTS